MWRCNYRHFKLSRQWNLQSSFPARMTFGSAIAFSKHFHSYRLFYQHLPTTFMAQWCLYRLTSSAKRAPGKLTYWFISSITVLYESCDKRFVWTARFIDLTFRSASKRVNINDDIDGWIEQNTNYVSEIFFFNFQTFNNAYKVFMISSVLQLLAIFLGHKK